MHRLPRLLHGDPSAPLRLADFPIRDPYILAHQPSKTYYLYASNNAHLSGAEGAGVMAYRSADLRAWERPIVVFTVPTGGWACPAEGPWAPEVHEYRGRYYLFATLHNPERFIARPPQVSRDNPMRSTVIAVSDKPDGPFRLIKPEAPVTPENFMVIDGTLYVDPQGQPWMVYVHEWIQKNDGTMEAIPLSDDLSNAAGEPMHLFKASDAPWINASMRPTVAESTYVTDGPQLFHSKDGHLLMLWSSFENGSYVQTLARSKTGRLDGPWEQLEPLVKENSGHGMLFRTFDDHLMMALHSPNNDARGKLYEMRDTGTGLQLVRRRADLDGSVP